MNATQIFNELKLHYLAEGWTESEQATEITKLTDLDHPFCIRLQGDSLIDMKMSGNYTSISIQHYTAQELNMLVKKVKEQFDYFIKSWTENPDAWK
jgi:hypothetical protein